MWKAWKKESRENNEKFKNNYYFLTSFRGRFTTASFITHEYFKNKYEQKITLPSSDIERAATNESIYIISPKNGDKVTNPVKVIFGLKDMGVAQQEQLKIIQAIIIC